MVKILLFLLQKFKIESFRVQITILCFVNISLKKLFIMSEENCCKEYKSTNHQANATGGAVYGLGFIGAAIYFISTAATFWVGVLGFLKAIVWPAILVYEALKMLAA
jgi:hypothetical protein